MVGVSSCVADWLMRRSPSDRTVASCFGLMPMMLFRSVTLSFLLGTGCLRPVTVHATPHRMQILEPLDPAQGVDGRLEDVVGIVRAEGLEATEHILAAYRIGINDALEKIARRIATYIDDIVVVARDIAEGK